MGLGYLSKETTKRIRRNLSRWTYDYFLQVRRGFDEAMCRLRREWAVYSDDWSQGPEQELIGAHKLGQRMAFCEFLENLRTLPHVTADSDCTLPLTVAETAAVQLEDETIETAINACSKFDAECIHRRGEHRPLQLLPFNLRSCTRGGKKRPTAPCRGCYSCGTGCRGQGLGFLVSVSGGRICE